MNGCPYPYENRAAARAALKRMGARKPAGLYAAHCNDCGRWHLRLRFRARHLRLAAA